MAAFLDLCRFVASTGGTADWAYSSTMSPYISPTDAGAVSGRVYKVRAESADLTQWEVSEGAYSSAGAGSFARTTVLYNSTGTGTKQSGAGSKINFTAAPQVWVVASKLDLLSIEEDNAFSDVQKTQGRKNLFAAPFQAMRDSNMAVNSALEVWQDGLLNAFPALTNGTAGYRGDQFEAEYNYSPGAVTVQSGPGDVGSITSPIAGLRYGLWITPTSGNIAAGSMSNGDRALLRQKIEGYRCARLRWGTSDAQPLAYAVGIKSAITGVAVLKFSNANKSRCYYVEVATTANQNVIASGVIPGDTSGTWNDANGIGLQVEAIFAGKEASPVNAANGWTASNVVQTTNSNISHFVASGNICGWSGLWLAPGTQYPTTAMQLAALMRPFEYELQLCKRYWRSTYEHGALDSFTSSSFAQAAGAFKRFPDSATPYNVVGQWRLDQPMRATPTGTIYAPGSGTIGKVRNMDAGTDLNGAVETAANNWAMIFVNNSSVGQSVTCAVHAVLNARL